MDYDYDDELFDDTIDAFEEAFVRGYREERDRAFGNPELGEI